MKLLGILSLFFSRSWSNNWYNHHWYTSCNYDCKLCNDLVVYLDQWKIFETIWAWRSEKSDFKTWNSSYKNIILSLSLLSFVCGANILTGHFKFTWSISTMGPHTKKSVLSTIQFECFYLCCKKWTVSTSICLFPAIKFPFFIYKGEW